MSFSYASIMQDADQARWSLEEVAGTLRDMDFGRPFLPEKLVHFGNLSYLAPDERLIANQIRAHSYLHVLGITERFILPFAVLHAGTAMHESSEELLALMRFGEEEAKHIALFERFSQHFEVGFGSVCETVGPADEIAGAVLARDPLAVALAALHVEWMTQDHFVRSVRGSSEIDERFKNLLRAHWAEEAQHARLDVLIIEKMVTDYSQADRSRALEAYVELLRRFGNAMRYQVELDREAFERAARQLSGPERDAWRETQLASYEHGILRAGVVHPKVRSVIEQHFEDAKATLGAAEEEWSKTV